MNVIEVDGGGVELSGRPILRGIDLAVPAGQVVALLGANGSGKSTLVKSMVGLLPLSMGTTRLFGTQVTSFTEWSRVGYVPQRSTMTQGVPSTVREVVAAGRLARRRPFLPERAADRAAIADALEAVGLADRTGQTVATLSGGQQQRVLMARTLAGGPELLLLDEPLAGVDVISQQALADALAVRAAAGATVVLVLHELGPFEPLIQRTVVLREGRVVHDGEPAGIAAFVHDHDVHCAPAVEPVPIAPLADPFGGGA